MVYKNSVRSSASRFCSELVLSKVLLSKNLSMKFVILCVLALIAVVYSRPESKYTDRFDNINIQEILNNKRLLAAYVLCVLEKGKCTNEGRELKSHIKDALETKCSKCTEVQRKGTETVIGHLINHEEDYWNQLVVKYDPERKYVVKYEKELRSVKA